MVHELQLYIEHLSGLKSLKSPLILARLKSKRNRHGIWFYWSFLSLLRSDIINAIYHQWMVNFEEKLPVNQDISHGTTANIKLPR